MIIYFSATGNSEHVAKKIALKTNDEVTPITKVDKINANVLGIISPTYAWGLPIIVEDYLKTILFINKPDYIYFVATYGTTCGATVHFVNNILKTKGLSLSSSFSVKMPDTWTPIFDLSEKDKVNRINNKADKEIDLIVDKVNKRQFGNYANSKAPYFLSKIVHKSMYENMRKTNNFIVEDTCVGCGLCVRNCPVKAIELKDNKPVWIKDKCVMCLSCLHHCPKFAIQYGDNTKRHGQYTHEKMV